MGRWLWPNGKEQLPAQWNALYPFGAMIHSDQPMDSKSTYSSSRRHSLTERLDCWWCWCRAVHWGLLVSCVTADETSLRCLELFSFTPLLLSEPFSKEHKIGWATITHVTYTYIDSLSVSEIKLVTFINTGSVNQSRKFQKRGKDRYNRLLKQNPRRTWKWVVISKCKSQEKETSFIIIIFFIFIWLL